MSFADAMEENFSLVFLQAGHFRRQAAYHPAGGGAARTVQALVEYSSGFTEGDYTRAEAEELVVSLMKDEAHELGGVSQPATGDRLHLAGDPDAKLYGWMGDVVSETPYSWSLRFKRLRPETVGRQTMRS